MMVEKNAYTVPSTYVIFPLPLLLTIVIAMIDLNIREITCQKEIHGLFHLVIHRNGCLLKITNTVTMQYKQTG